MQSLVVLNKPKRGEPCNRCGKCCERELCATALAIYSPRTAPCPALLRNADGTTTCGHWDTVKLWVRLGGCFAPDEFYSVESEAL